MSVRLMKWIKGYVICTLTGKHFELFINMAMKSGIDIWNFKIVGTNRAIFSISIHDFFLLRPILKKTYARVHVIERNGFPFLFSKLLKRKGIIAASILFIALLYSFSLMIWSIQVEGNKQIKKEVIYQAVHDIGIHKGQFKFQLPSQEEIQRNLLAKLEEDIVWVGVKVEGTKLSITIAEKIKPEDKDYVGPTNVVSKKNAMIYKVLAEKGLPMVKVNDRVKKGDILISGVMGSEENKQLVTAKGTVEGIVWYQSNATIPLKQYWKEYTGNFIERNYLAIGKRMIKYKGEGNITFDKYTKSYNYKRLSWKDYQLPVVFVNEKVLEYEDKERILTKDEALQLALSQMKKDLFNKVDRNSKIISEKVLHQSFDNDKLTIKILYEVIEDITTIKPIIQGE